jgi:hypothetical protein
MKVSKNLKILIAVGSLFVISAIILITSFFVWTNDSYSDAQSRSNELYKNEKLGFSVEVDLTMDEIEESNKSARFSSSQGTSKITISKNNYSSFLFKDESFNGMIDSYRECLNNQENCIYEEFRDISKVETFELDGRQAIRIEGLETPGFSIDPYSLTRIVIDNGDNYYILELSYNTEIPFESKIFEKAVDSFEII